MDTDLKGFKKTISISLTPEEWALVRKVGKQLDIGATDIFRRGLREYEQDAVKDLAQNNTS